MSKDVDFQIKLVQHKDNRSQLEALAKLVGETQSNLGRSMELVGKGFNDQLASARREMEALRTQSSSLVTAGGGGGGSGGSGAGRGEEINSLRDDLAKALQEANSLRVGIEGVDKAADAATVGMKELAGTDLGALEGELAGVVGKIGEIDAASATTVKELSANTRELASSIEGASSGLGQLAGGLAFLGASNENAKELVNTLLTIKGASDVFIGFGKTISGTISTLALLGDRQKLNTKTTDLAAQRTDLLTHDTRELIAALEREIQTAQRSGTVHKQKIQELQALSSALKTATANTVQLDAAEDRLNANVSKGRGLKGLAGKVGGSVLSGGIGGLLSGGGLTGAIGGAASSAVGGIGGAAGIGAVAAPASAAAAALAAVGLVGKEVQEVLSGTANKAGSLTDTIGKTEASFGASVLSMTGTGGFASALGDLVGDFGVVKTTLGDFDLQGLSTIGAFGDLAKSTDDLSRATKRTAKEIEERRLGEAISRGVGNIEYGYRTSLRTESRQMGLAQINQRGGTGDEKLDLLNLHRSGAADELARQGATIDGGTARDEDIAIAYERSKGLADELLDIDRSRIAIIQSEGDIQRKAAEESLRSAKDRLKAEKDILATAEEGLLSAKERFANLNKADQLEAIKAGQLVSTGQEDLLSEEQRNLLRSVGTKDAVSAARRQDVAEADRLGFDSVFGASERASIAQSSSNAKQFEIDIDASNQINVNFAQDEKRLIDEINRSIDKTYADRMKRVAEGLKAGMQTDLNAFKAGVMEEFHRRDQERNNS